MDLHIRILIVQNKKLRGIATADGQWNSIRVIPPCGRAVIRQVNYQSWKSWYGAGELKIIPKIPNGYGVNCENHYHRGILWRNNYSLHLRCFVISCQDDYVVMGWSWHSNRGANYKLVSSQYFFTITTKSKINNKNSSIPRWHGNTKCNKTIPNLVHTIICWCCCYL